MKKAIIGIGKKLLPANTSRRVWAKHFLLQTGLFTRLVEDLYQQWIKNIEPKLVSQSVEHKYRPLISILVPTYNTPDKYLVPLIESVMRQSYKNWELCIADGSTKEERRSAIAKMSGQDERIKYRQLNMNYGISGNTNQALKLAQGEFIALLDHDDVLAPFALNEVVTVLQQKKDLDLIYSDEDLCNDRGNRRFNPFFKPDWSPDLLWCLNYITHFVVARRRLVEKLNGLRTDCDGAQDYDLLLRIMEKTDKIHHIPKMLYHWRMAEGSTAKGGIHIKEYALMAGQKALEDALKRRKLNGKVWVDEKRLGNYRTDLRFKSAPRVALTIPYPYDAQRVGLYLSKLLEHTDYPQLEIYLHEEPKNLPPSVKVKLFETSITNQWRKLAESGVDIVLGIQSAYLPEHKDWLDKLVGPLQQPHLGAVTGLVLDNQKNIHDYGMFKNGTEYKPAYKGIKHSVPTLSGFITWPRNFTTLSGGLFVIKSQNITRYMKDSHLAQGMVTPAFFEHLSKNGLLNLGWPYAIFHKTNFSLRVTDPLFNPNLVHDKAQINLANHF